jgi:hypothetical protein
MIMLKKLVAALVLASAVTLAPVGAFAEDKMLHKEMNLEKNHVKREHRHYMMRHHGLIHQHDH